jgi:hypothetical protein
VKNKRNSKAINAQNKNNDNNTTTTTKIIDNTMKIKNLRDKLRANKREREERERQRLERERREKFEVNGKKFMCVFARGNARKGTY